jgi:hypothetical protein
VLKVILRCVFYSGLYLPIYTLALALSIRIMLEHMCPDLIDSQNLILLELQLKVAQHTLQIF